jgi:LmbE family N-acetylglucosaminyl deacetylase
MTQALKSEIYIPDGVSADEAFARTTHFAIVAHPDDLEISMYHGIAECYGRNDRWFTGIICTDGAGSVTPPGMTREELPDLRWREQCEAAHFGGYSAVVGFKLPSSELVGYLNEQFLSVLGGIISKMQPEIVYTHNPFDRHATHVAVGLHAIEAMRRAGASRRPQRFLGCEGWRDLDWLPSPWRVELDTALFPELAGKLLRVYFSQIDVGKRYDLATLGRRASHATFSEPRAIDRTTQLTLACDLLSLLDDPQLKVVDFADKVLRHFRDDLISALSVKK